MKKFFSANLVFILCAAFAWAQQAQGQESKATAEGHHQTSASKSGKDLTLESGTQLAGQLQTALDARKLKEGDPVILKTTKDIKSNGEVIFKKGSLLTGHVTEARKKSKDNKESKIGLVFDRLENASLFMPVSATLTSVTQAATNANLGGDDLFATSSSANSNSRASASGSQGSGGLLGGVTSTVGGVVNSTTQTVGGVVNATSGTVAGTAGAVGQPLQGLQISQATSANATGGSTLSLAGDNLKLEKGTVFSLLLNQDAMAETKAKNKEAKNKEAKNKDAKNDNP